LTEFHGNNVYKKYTQINTKGKKQMCTNNSKQITNEETIKCNCKITVIQENHHILA